MEQYTAALAGNPNVGKSTVFNALTGMHQHTGNWPGKTVEVAEGAYVWRGASFRLVDLPGTYSLRADSPEEELARGFICGGNADVTVVVADATCLRRNLHLAVQLRSRTPRLVLCLNLMDEARKKGVTVDTEALSRALAAPVVTTATFSSATTWATSSTKGLISMMFTPKGRLVRDLATWICSRTASPGALPAAMMPRPPPSDTAAASLPSAIQAMPPWNTGYSMPSRSHNGVRIMPACSQ